MLSRVASSNTNSAVKSFTPLHTYQLNVYLADAFFHTGDFKKAEVSFYTPTHCYQYVLSTMLRKVTPVQEILSQKSIIVIEYGFKNFASVKKSILNEM